MWATTLALIVSKNIHDHLSSTFISYRLDISSHVCLSTSSTLLENYSPGKRNGTIIQKHYFILTHRNVLVLLYYFLKSMQSIREFYPMRLKISENKAYLDLNDLKYNLKNYEIYIFLQFMVLFKLYSDHLSIFMSISKIIYLKF
ncbi:MAG: hypothetical protein RsTaC01_0801 [Candidatus Paraimprobicoccus trichonymphae]|uniref:Uncharacterized protein n=1 Tax=Candidatus Paraimprobicoccus trichonymphae TaxID=3033793 RepID=A0AA48I361_9FIRM|nr:MAG: hypothetical protein RsTaC01_0801 [Candidatus Paraimprobicoccus trichonymphae]